MKRFIRLVLAVCIALIAVLFADKKLSPELEKQTRQLVSRMTISPTPTPVPLSTDTLIALVNQKRTENSMTTLTVGKQTCAVLHMYTESQHLTTEQIRSACPTCKSLNIYTYSEPMSEKTFLDATENDASMSALFKNKTITHTCAESVNGSLFLATVEVGQTPAAPKQPKEISEDELWSALGEYRKDHQVPELSHDEKLCVYARKRLQDQLTLLKENKPAASYPIPAKYPLDAHDGFKKDADTGYVFEVTNRSVVAENLAYWPTATYGVHVIEWGWDTSTEGHRETQLSTEYTAACLTGSKGFYVAIFAK